MRCLQEKPRRIYVVALEAIEKNGEIKAYRLVGFREPDNIPKNGLKYFYQEAEKQIKLSVETMKNLVSDGSLVISNLSLDDNGEFKEKPIETDDLKRGYVVEKSGTKRNYTHFTNYYIVSLVKYANQNKDKALDIIDNHSDLFYEDEIKEVKSVINTGDINEYRKLDTLEKQNLLELLTEKLVEQY